MNHYELLEISVDATSQEIKAAYYRLSKELHPDRLPPNTPPRARQLIEEQYKQINAAYSVLSDAAQRRAYDAQQPYPHRTVATPHQNRAAPQPQVESDPLAWFDEATLTAAAERLQRKITAQKNHIHTHFDDSIQNLHNTLAADLQKIGYVGDVEKSYSTGQRNQFLGLGVIVSGLGWAILLGTRSWLTPIFGIGLQIAGALVIVFATQIKAEDHSLAVQARKLRQAFKEGCEAAAQLKEQRLQVIDARLKQRMQYFQAIPPRLITQKFVASLSAEDQVLLLAALKHHRSG